MVLVSRLLARAPFAAPRMTLFAPASTRVCLVTIVNRVYSRRSIHVPSPQTQAPPGISSAENASVDELPSSDVPSLQVNTHSNWRHPLLGFTADEASEFIFFRLPRATNEDDVKALLAKAGLDTAQVFLEYNLETGKPQGRCYLRIAERHDVDAAVAALSQLTLFDRPLQPTRFDPGKASPADLHGLNAGWLPSPTSDLTSRVLRPPMTEPPELLAPLLNDQWVVFKHLEGLYPKLKSKKLDPRHVLFDVARDLYTRLHQYDVVGMTELRKTRQPHGWSCKILFGNASDARQAAALWRKSFAEKRTDIVKIYRSGPDVHRKLWDYRQSLPKDASDEEKRVLLELKYKELRNVPNDGERLQRANHPTPESAIGVNEEAAAAV